MTDRQGQKLLIVFTRYPRPGTTKTRLARVLGARGAADMQKKLTGLTLEKVRELQHRDRVDIFVYFEGGGHKLMQEWLGASFNYREQSAGDLGQRMAAAFHAGFKEKYKRIVIIGTDCPALNISHIRQAYEALGSQDLVLGPATDGGYYLIGLRRSEESLFAHISWGTADVLAETLKRAREKKLSIACLEKLSDIDRPEDLKHLQGPHAAIGPGRTCSVIVPTRNEAENIAELLPELMAVPDLEVIVADGGSTDNTVAAAAALGARVLRVSPGRAAQMNAGAEAAEGEFLLFLHADTRLAPDFADALRQTLNQPGVAAGAFRLAIDGRGLGLRAVEWLANARCRLLQMPYGDQGIFLTKEMFSAVGGYPALPIMEDYELVRRLRRKGRIKILPLPAHTSARRWETLGIVRTTCINRAIILGYLLGVDPRKLASWYGIKR